MYYEYAPKPKKGGEMITTLLLFGVALAVYYVSLIPKIPYPALYQTAAVAIAAVAVLVVGKTVLRSFTYRVEPRENGDPNETDLVICEQYGRRNTVVCRIGTEQIRSVVRPEKSNRAELAKRMKQCRVYRYTAGFSAPDLCIVEASAEADANGAGSAIFLKIRADEKLASLLAPRNSNFCPPYNEK